MTKRYGENTQTRIKQIEQIIGVKSNKPINCLHLCTVFYFKVQKHQACWPTTGRVKNTKIKASRTDVRVTV